MKGLAYAQTRAYRYFPGTIFPSAPEIVVPVWQTTVSSFQVPEVFRMSAVKSVPQVFETVTVANAA